MNESAKIDRAQKAQRLLNDELFNEAFNLTRQAIFERIETTPLRDVEGLSQLRLCLKLLGDVKANIKQILNDGKVAEFNIEQQKRELTLADFRSKR